MNPLVFTLAHAGHQHLDAAQVMTWWSWEPAVVALLAVSGAMYFVGYPHVAGKSISRWQAAAFWGGWLALVIALLSPVDALGGILFSAHMVQHELLMVVAAPLLVLGRPLIAFLWALPPGQRLAVGELTRRDAFARSWHAVSAPLVAALLHGIALWVWHIPSWYEATLRSEVIHTLQHTSFLGTATLFWWTLIHGRYGRMGYGMAVVYTFVTAIHSGALGALIAFSPNVWYPIYIETTSKWGLNPLEDQQLAGFLMWIPAGVILSILGVALFAAWLGEAERRIAVEEKK